MNEQQFREMMDRVYNWLRLVEEDEDCWNLPAKFTAMVRSAFVGSEAQEWFTRWREGQPARRDTAGDTSA